MTIVRSRVPTENPPGPMLHGAKGDGTTDDTAALTAWLAAGYTQGAVPPGTYLTTATLTQPATMKVTFAPGATIKASATIAGPIWETPVGTAVNQGFLSGATFDCNGNAQNGVYLRYVQHFELSDITVLTPTSHGVVLGDPAAAANSYEVMVHNLSVWRASGSSVPSGSYGLWLRNASDCEVVQATIVGAETGVRNDTGDNRFANVHVWGYSSHNPVTGFDDNANATTWVGCIADTPTTYGFRLRQFNTVLVGCKVYVGTFGGVDNVVIGVQADQTTPFFTAVGCIFQGNDSSHRLARDFGGTLSSSQMIGTQTSNTAATATTNTASAVKVIGVSSAAFNVTGSSQWVNINSNFTGHALEMVNGTPVKGYSGNFTNQTFELVATTGGVRSGSTAGLGATVFSGSGAPTIAGTAGDRYLRTDTPSTSNQREYICTVTGIAGAATWVGIV